MSTEGVSSKHLGMPELSQLQSLLRAFATSSRKFQIVHSVLAPSGSARKLASKLYVLDSSFNPPTRAHERLCTSALAQHERTSSPASARLLLLLATQNADKAAQPAAFEQRLSMMGLLAETLNKECRSLTSVDIGITKLPMFVDKVVQIEETPLYQVEQSTQARTPLEQVHLIGFDTLVRLLNTKYYPPRHTLASLETLFGNHCVRATKRSADTENKEAHVQDEQEAYVQDLAAGKLAEMGGKNEWAAKIDLVEGRRPGEDSISSTKVRQAVHSNNRDALKGLLQTDIADWIMEEQLYKDNL